MNRVPFPADVSDTTRRYPRTLEQAFGPYQRQSVIVPMGPPDSGHASMPLSALLICIAAAALALLSGCTGADAGEKPQPKHLVAQQEQRRAVAAAHLCGPGKTAVWHDSFEMQCMREVNP
ncbi:hypothetical protein ACQYWY_06990 [Comamonas sediminis]|uniref:hypothetical protein n=1 Tax=Comamonas sediminis TaxID=1783360 RepID=UPI003D27014C